MSFNKIIIVGNLGRDPELRYTPSGTAVCNFSVATNERHKDGSGEWQERATWFRVSAWGRKAEVVNQYLRKGSQAYIEGRLSVREYTDREGVLRTSLDVSASDIQFLDRRTDVSQDVPAETSAEDDASPSPPAEDEVPF